MPNNQIENLKVGTLKDAPKNVVFKLKRIELQLMPIDPNYLFMGSCTIDGIEYGAIHDLYKSKLQNNNKNCTHIVEIVTAKDHEIHSWKEIEDDAEWVSAYEFLNRNKIIELARITIWKYEQNRKISKNKRLLNLIDQETRIWKRTKGYDVIPVNFLDKVERISNIIKKESWGKRNRALYKNHNISKES